MATRPVQTNILKVVKAYKKLCPNSFHALNELLACFDQYFLYALTYKMSWIQNI